MPNANIATRSAKPTRKMLISTPEFIADTNARLRVFLIYGATVAFARATLREPELFSPAHPPSAGWRAFREQRFMNLSR